MAKGRKGRTDRPTFAEIVAVERSEDRVKIMPSILAVPGPSSGPAWTDPTGVEWRPRSVKFARLCKLIEDPETPVMGFNNWNGSLVDIAPDQRLELIAKIKHDMEDSDPCLPLRPYEFRNGHHQSLVMVEWFE